MKSILWVSPLNLVNDKSSSLWITMSSLTYSDEKLVAWSDNSKRRLYKRRLVASVVFIPAQYHLLSKVTTTTFVFHRSSDKLWRLLELLRLFCSLWSEILIDRIFSEMCSLSPKLQYSCSVRIIIGFDWSALTVVDVCLDTFLLLLSISTYLRLSWILVIPCVFVLINFHSAVICIDLHQHVPVFSFLLTSKLP